MLVIWAIPQAASHAKWASNGAFNQGQKPEKLLRNFGNPVLRCFKQGEQEHLQRRNGTKLLKNPCFKWYGCSYSWSFLLVTRLKPNVRCPRPARPSSHEHKLHLHRHHRWPWHKPCESLMGTIGENTKKSLGWSLPAMWPSQLKVGYEVIGHRTQPSPWRMDGIPSWVYRKLVIVKKMIFPDVPRSQHS